MKKIKRISKDKEVKKIFSASQVMMLLEKMDGNTQLVAEGLIGLERRMGEVEANQKITLKHLFNIDDKFELMEKELKEIKFELIRIGERKLTPKENDSLSRRVELLEREMVKYKVFMKGKAELKSA
ncbi:MAG: hypothetical protein NTY33_03845 [Candidatus Moranbacteria bacterium]|nr:hypothetical protein [Candidatus Moranbacteria bacterium]